MLATVWWKIVEQKELSLEDLSKVQLIEYIWLIKNGKPYRNKKISCRNCGVECEMVYGSGIWRFCSINCKNEHRNIEWKKKYWPSLSLQRGKEKIPKTCKYCWKLLYTSYYNRITCSMECAANIKRHIWLSKKKCELCWKKYIWTKTHKYCSYYCALIKKMSQYTLNKRTIDQLKTLYPTIEQIPECIKQQDIAQYDENLKKLVKIRNDKHDNKDKFINE